MQVWQFIALEKLFHFHMPLFSEVTITAPPIMSRLKTIPMPEFSNVKPSVDVL